MTDRAGATKLQPGGPNHEWAVILAGGNGTRLKSLPRRMTGDERPKQFCRVMGELTLVEAVAPLERFMIASAEALIDIIASATPASYNALASAMRWFRRDDELTTMKKLYSLQ